jgi:MoaA/NifB/PqqE/SkfB family radical SAM enzyme
MLDTTRLDRTSEPGDGPPLSPDCPPTAAGAGSWQDLIGGGEWLTVRNNHVTKYVRHLPKYFESIANDRLDQAPPPICVQLQISARCPTKCVMCDHWKLPGARRDDQLSADTWRDVFRQLSGFGVHTVVLSGGEPLENKDLPDLLQDAKECGLKIGLLTTGHHSDNDPPNDRQTQLFDAVRTCVDWASISIDGSEIEDHLIRQPKASDRVQRLKTFVQGIKGGPALSATVTLQKENAGMELEATCAFINSIGIDNVRFKLATGATGALAAPPTYLLDRDELDSLEQFLYKKQQFTDHDGNNLDYVRRCFASGMFSKDDAARGAPVRSFYKEEPVRCFTPFLFALIDVDGKVYPCCHLYRDNHGMDDRSAGFREMHCLGDVKKETFGEIWNGPRYAKKRKELEVIKPDHPNFTPCGECTRHCHHNKTLTALFAAVKDDLPTFRDEVESQFKEDQAVWF